MKMRVLMPLAGLIAVLAIACGGSATAVPTVPAVPATSAPAPAATAPPATSAPQITQILSGPLAVVDVKEPTIQSPRGESKGTLRIALHYGFSPAWLDAQEAIGGVTYNFGYIMHDAMIKPMPEYFP